MLVINLLQAKKVESVG